VSSSAPFFWKNLWRSLTDALFAELLPGEALSLSLAGEESLFLRFNNSTVRQSTQVDQFAIELLLQKNHRQAQMSFSLTGQIKPDLEMGRALLARCRSECHELPEDAFLVPLSNHGTSFEESSAILPSPKEAIDSIIEAHSGIDHSGFYSGGPILRANRNSLGQDHWFSAHNFFYDYSLFTINVEGANKAVKGCYSERNWNSENLTSQIARNNELLKPLQRANRILAPGAYRAYLAPGAMSEIATLLSWGSVGLGAYRQGRSSLAKLADGTERLSPLFSFGENFRLGVSPRFNSLGEVAPETMPVVEKGLLKNWIVSSRSSQEYKIPGNAGDPSEGLRSLEILPGHLPEKSALKSLGTGVFLGNLHYLNWSDIPNARVTGMSRYACFWVENGEIVAPIQDMRFDESFYRFFGSELEALTQESYLEPDISTYGRREVGGRKLPGILLSEFRLKM
jgi:predicted Zn-dependent protease